MGRIASVTAAAIMLAALVGVAVPQATTSLSVEDKALLAQIVTALGQLTSEAGGPVIKTAVVDSGGAELNYIPPDDATVTVVPYSSSPFFCPVANVLRQGARIYNNSNQALLLLEDTGTPTTSNFTIKIEPGGLYVLPMNTNGVYTGPVNCWWPTVAIGSVVVTEIIS